MDPEAARNLQSDILKAYKARKKHEKSTRVDTITFTLETTPHTSLPPPSCEPSLPEFITVDNLKGIITQYHEQTVQPSIKLVSNHVRH